MEKVLTVLLALIAVAGFGGARAAEGTWASSSAVQARLLSAAEAAGEGREVSLALDIRLASGWKTYWRSPGDAGLPPRLDWAGSVNLAQAELLYPAPKRHSLQGLETAGYEKAVVFPIRATVAEPGRPLVLKAAVALLVCSDLCVPETLVVSLSLPGGPALPGPEAGLVARAAASVPGDGAAQGLVLTSLAADSSGLVATVVADPPLVRPDLFAETAAALPFAAPIVRLEDGGKRAVLRLPLAEGAGVPLPATGEPVTLTLVDGERAAEFRAAVGAGGPAPGRLPWVMLFTALLGGLILNLMPCVLPVLSIKLLAVAEAGGQAPRIVRGRFLATAAGILASFLLLALGLIAIRAAGGAVGWGIQFQSPLFLAVMAGAMTVFALSLWDRVAFALPAALSGRIGGRESGGLWGAFGTGFLATALATPCSAPFVGTAVGFALAAGSAEIVEIFAALGLGLAAPWLAVAGWPRVAAVLPKPGPWMVVLRRVLGLATLATALWLVSVLGRGAGWGMALAVVAVLAALSASLVARDGRWRRPALAALTAALLAVPLAGGTPAARPAPGAGWVPFDEAAILRLVGEGKTVFVDATADWCLTCIANERLVLARDPVAGRLSAANVVAMRADWTRPDPAVSAFLARFGRYGVPLNAVFGPNRPDGRLLPELLTADTVIDALDAVGVKSQK